MKRPRAIGKRLIKNRGKETAIADRQSKFVHSENDILLQKDEGQSVTKLNGSSDVGALPNGKELDAANRYLEISQPTTIELRAKDTIKPAVIDQIDVDSLRLASHNDAKAKVADIVRDVLQDAPQSLTIAQAARVIDLLADEIVGYGPLEPLMRRDDVNDIMVNGPNSVYVEISGLVYRTNIKFRSEEQLLSLCQRMVGEIGRRVDESSPICDARLRDGSRVNVITKPLAVNGTTLTIRKFRADSLELSDLIYYNSIDENIAILLKAMGKSRLNILISGGTGSGKTTLLNILGGTFGSKERIVTCEDAAELQLQQPHVVTLETRPPNLEGEGEVTMRSLIKNSLRMRPDRIVVGEVRGGEAFDLLQAMNTGHEGSMGTIHANGARDALSRLEGLVVSGAVNLPVRVVKEMIVTAIDVIIHVSRLRSGRRVITQISEVVGIEDDQILLQDLLVYDQLEGNGVFKGTQIVRPRFLPQADRYNQKEKIILALKAINEII
jgi:pilus assembly protein CpaF